VRKGTGYVEYDWAPLWGYQVYVNDAQGEMIAEYTAGNTPGDSVTRSNRDYHLPLGRWARQTALEMAKERDIPAKKVFRNSDLLEEERLNDSE